MTNVLVLKSSILGPHSSSAKLIEHWVEQQGNNISLIERDLVANPLPLLDANVLAAFSGKALSEEQEQLLALSDQLITEIKVSDLLVIGAPMYNFSVPTQLKLWVDLIARAGVTFQYTENGPQGLLKGKKAKVITTRGGLHQDKETDNLVPYLKTVLGFVGIEEVEFIYAEGLSMGEDIANEHLSQAKAALTGS
ncbi:FMN-dependent NADH-azoreductase [Thaumasiovibrio subtropicus]|uniref:FMN-dependent NADH-azoreductase n=1 Tax=Thaumasiovibrio subtropicus TaxID=1891207 RepID=UPI000B34F807|nr:FMN-dependent NADH-azoreductase [Thaumasiovibrio subtropicus]